MVQLSDESSSIELKFFHFFKQQESSFAQGRRLRCYGEVKSGYRQFEIIHPEYTFINPRKPLPLAEQLTPIYPSTDKVSQKLLFRLTEQALESMNRSKLELEDYLPRKLLEQYQLPSLKEAINYVHRPPPNAPVAALLSGNHRSQTRLVVEELLAHHLSMLHAKKLSQSIPANALHAKHDYQERLLQSLSFTLTAAQKKVSAEIIRDCKKSYPMLRLLQGDVGSGKTIVAALAAVHTIASGSQTVLLAPTEILAEQHFRSFDHWLAPMGIKLVWLKGKLKGAARESLLAQIATDVDMIISTHAIFENDIVFRKLDLIIIDEQHRFGVNQRLNLSNKADIKNKQAPHQLIMTATPIPRTLAMSAYANMDLSVIDELPAGRMPIKTAVINNRRRTEIISRIEQTSASMRQTYWVCTLIEESENIQAQAAADVKAELESLLPRLTIGLIHGRLNSAAKESEMKRFLDGDTHLLVATTVIEVGVDVSNASLIIIDNAERLGLAQLHQLRGRVGRGSHASSCVLLYDDPLSEKARQRLAIMRQTNDGFKIAEEDLKIRGPGELLGTRQSGSLNFKIAQLARDQEWLDILPTLAADLNNFKPDTIPLLIARWLPNAEQFTHA